MHMRVTATLTTPVIGTINPLDAILSWAAAQAAIAQGVELPPISDEYVHDFDLPLETWSKDGYWGWCSSSPVFETVHYSAAEFRRRPAVNAMAAFTTAKEHHSGLGPMKAANVTQETAHHKTISWEVNTTDHDRLRQLLATCTHLGARHRNGFGRVAHWEITDGTPNGWKNRPMPNPHGVEMRVRAPYWHPTERTPCA